MKVCFSLVLVVFFGFGKSSSFNPYAHENWNLLPNEECGEVSSSRIIGGVEAEMNAYPWLVRIGYIKDGSLIFLCGGAIINAWTIVTAAHCLKDTQVATVRLGEHDINTDPDCNGQYCADPVVDVEPAGVIYHENYDNPKLKNDIGVILLKNKIKFTDFVKPICLSDGKLLHSDLVGQKAEIAGWGILNIESSKTSDILQTLQIPIKDNSVCQSYLPSFVKMHDTQMCAGGIVGQDSCGGDSGGPLMKVFIENDRPRYYLLGLVSFGAKRCGKVKMPGIYTRISSYTEWLLNNMLAK